jgi:hypothetical protein
MDEVLNATNRKEGRKMGLLGDILAMPVRILNIPARAVERLVDPDSELGAEDNHLSKPLESLAKAIEEIDED